MLRTSNTQIEPMPTYIQSLSYRDKKPSSSPRTSTRNSTFYMSSTYQPTTTSRPGDSPDSDNFSQNYKMAAEVAVAAAVVVALAILLALIWNSLKRRLRRNASNVDGMPSSSSSGRRYSVDSLERLVEDRLRNRPPPYTPDQDKPPSYEDSFQDPSSRHPSPTPHARSRRERRRQQPPRQPQAEQVAINLGIQQLNGDETVPSPPPYQEWAPAVNQQHQHQIRQLATAGSIRTVSYNNQAFDEVESEIPSISMAVDRAQIPSVSNGENSNDEDGVFMLHL